MGRRLTRGEIWLAEVGRKARPVLVLTRPEVIDVRASVTIAEVTTTIRGIAAEVGLDVEEIGLAHPSAVNCDGIHTVARSSLTKRIGAVDTETMRKVCWSINYALGC
ncbi:MAG: type II toxin-antitoxin system PemK/MazF family toxin [Acidimicrobiia bacterium]